MNLIVPTAFDYVNSDAGLMQNGLIDSGIDRLSDRSTLPYEAPPTVSPKSLNPFDQTALDAGSLTENRCIDFHTTVRSSLPTSNRVARLHVAAPPMQRQSRHETDSVNMMKSEKGSVEVHHFVDWQLLCETRPTIICASIQ